MVTDHSRERPESAVSDSNSGGTGDDPRESSAENREDGQNGGSGSEIDREPGVARADESRERPEQAVTDNSSKTGGTGNPIADTFIQTADTVRQNPPQDEDEE